jgi:hypothetical protein
MAKKSSKKQLELEQSTTASPGNTATVSTTVPPSVTSPAPYKPITDDVSIERLVGLAKDSQPDSALGIVWRHAYEEGYQNGRKEVLQNLGRKLEEKFKEGEKEGVKKGRELYYGKGIVRGEYDEHERWKTAGHGQRCFVATTHLEDSETQTDPPAVTITSVFTQTNPISPFSATYSTSGTQTNPPATILHPTMDVFGQTNSASTSTNRHHQENLKCTILHQCSTIEYNCVIIAHNCAHWIKWIRWCMMNQMKRW